MNHLLAGIARRVISPPKGIYLIGYGDRTFGNKGVRDDLTATAITFSDGSNQVCFVACDLLAINEQTVARIRQITTKETVVCCSHTHSGPIVYADRKSSKRNQKYVAFLVSQIAAAVIESGETLQPVSISWGQGESDIAVNRRERKPDNSIEIGRNPDGPMDRSIHIIQIKSIYGAPVANLINFSCHNVVLGPRNLLVSADWAGSMRRRTESVTGVPTLFIQGATADLNPDHDWDSDDSQVVEDLGERVAQQALAAMANSTPIRLGPISTYQEEVWIPLEAKATTGEPPKTYRKVLAQATRLPSFLVDPLLNYRYPWVTQVEARSDRWSIPLALTLVQIGNLLWIGYGAEVFNEIGTQIKDISPAEHTIFSSMTNGCIGYLPTSDEHLLGGYEIDLAPYFYRLPGKLDCSSAKIVQRRVESQLQHIYYPESSTKKEPQ